MSYHIFKNNGTQSFIILHFIQRPLLYVLFIQNKSSNWMITVNVIMKDGSSLSSFSNRCGRFQKTDSPFP